ncbi:PAS domain-containing sensor histidine kinase [Sphingomonas xanthus]|uniref:histidine kinase n=1 Tax=Sphingomonas xanthus TaxID=2594473 RepID=A0A516IUA3_9SPHN|nr:PAS domain-containing sensor histidine kinase [Sphingomonas xanthus]
MTADARIAKVNRTLTDWLQCSHQELVGKSIHEILSFGGKIAFETHLAPMLRLQGEAQEIAFDLQLGDGEKLPVFGNAKEKRGPSGEHLFTRLTLFKAIERRTFERSLIEAKVRAEERFNLEHGQLELRDQFIAVLGHDLRNPLAAILAGTQMLERQAVLDERGAMIVREMRASLSRANALIDDVLDFAMGRLGKGIQLDYSAEGKLAEVLSQVVHEIKAIAPDVELVFNCGDLGSVQCDPARIGQLTSNLLSNAVKYGDRSQPIVLEAAIDGELFHLSVANSGDPIPEPALAKLFQPFERGRVSDREKGLGLGLFIAHEIAVAHGGEVTVSSTIAETRFTLSMPRKHRNAASGGERA